MNPLDLPVHPAVVHFPVAMLSAAWVCILLRHSTQRPTWAVRARLFETVGVAALPVTIVAGLIDLRGVQPLAEERWDQPLIWHVLAALSGSVLFAGHAVITRRLADRAVGPSLGLDLGLSTAGLWLIVLAGMLASEMIYAT